MKAEEVMNNADNYGLMYARGERRNYDEYWEETRTNARANLEKQIACLTQAEALLAEMVKQKDAGFINEDGWLLCCHCGHMQENGRYDHFKTCTITRARELLGIEV